MSVYIPSEEDERTQGRTHKLENKARHSAVNTGLSNSTTGTADLEASGMNSSDMEENLYVKDKKA